MSNEKQDNWRRKLLELDGMPGEAAYDKDAAWQQLQTRLQPPHHKNTYWYWAAAFLLLATAWWMLPNRETGPLPARDTAQQKLSKPSAPSRGITVKENNPAIAIVSNPLAKKTAANTLPKNKKHKPDLVAAVTLPAPDLDSNKLIVNPVIIQADSAATAAVAVNIEKKVPVVHINELETAAPALTFSTIPLHGRWRTKRSLRSSASPLATAQKGDNSIINIRLSSKN